MCRVGSGVWGDAVVCVGVSPGGGGVGGYCVGTGPWCRGLCRAGSGVGMMGVVVSDRVRGGGRGRGGIVSDRVRGTGGGGRYGGTGGVGGWGDTKGHQLPLGLGGHDDVPPSPHGLYSGTSPTRPEQTAWTPGPRGPATSSRSREPQSRRGLGEISPFRLSVPGARPRREYRTRAVWTPEWRPVAPL